MKPPDKTPPQHPQQSMAGEMMVEHIALDLSRELPPPPLVSRAIVAWQPPMLRDAAAAAPLPARPPPMAEKAVRVRLRLRTRPALPHELASATPLAAGDSPPAASDRRVAILLADGGRLWCDPALLARHSSVLAMLTGHSAAYGAAGATATPTPSARWREVETGEIALLDHPPHVVRGVIAWMEAPSGAAKREAAAALISPEDVVELARLSNYLDCQPLLRAALVAIGGALDVENAPSCLVLARELNDYTLERKAIHFIVERLESVQQRADGWTELPQSSRVLLSALRDATSALPMRMEVVDVGEPRELLGMVRESLVGQVERLESARERQLQQPHHDGGVVQMIETQARRVRELEAYLQRQEAIFTQLLGTARDVPSGAASHSTTPPSGEQGGFVPSYEWQTLAEDCHSVSAGLEVEMPLDDRPRRARIPPRWTLRVWLGYELGFWRLHDVGRQTTVLQIRTAAADFAGVAIERVHLRLGGVDLSDDQTAEEISLFNRTSVFEVIFR
ncbi:hypothetical protein AB1Y20_018393 [Prymnesium parvum]|uniref:Ubiquitin-like domain-containing protein n=1 Tax=Prymnesium parvum TaxID=97485 RepID=A0AB34JQL3_PRYPA